MIVKNKIKMGVSSCLLGEKVRWNGSHKQDRYVRDVLARYFEYVPICPEMEVGMGVPGETVALYGSLEKSRMISKKTQTDGTKPMGQYNKDVSTPSPMRIFADTYSKANLLHVA